MTIPSYKKIHLKSEQMSDITDQLSSLSFYRSPHIIIIDHLKDEQHALNNLEVFFEKSLISFDTYPLYIVTKLQDVSGELNLIKQAAQAPKFFQQRIKPLNVKENQLLNKIELKQKNLNALRYSDYKKELQAYALGHKTIKLLYKEGQFLQELNQALDKKDGK